jgi:hypothetical protein
MQNEHGIKIVEIAVEAEQHVADEREDPERDHGAHAEGGKHARRGGVAQKIDPIHDCFASLLPARRFGPRFMCGSSAINDADC